MSPKDQNDMSGLVVPKLGSNHWTEDTDFEYLQKMYDCHDLVYNCIELCSSTFALGKLRVKRLNSKGKYEFVPDHPLQKLLNNPNATMTAYDLSQAYMVHRLLNGTVAFILLRGSQTVSNDEAAKCPECQMLDVNQCEHLLWHFHLGPITQIIPIHPDRLQKKKYRYESGIKEYFMYKWDNGVEMLVHPNNMLTDPMYNPGGTFYGSSPTARVKRWLEIDLGLSKQTGAYLLNNAIPSMILNIKPQEGMLDQDPSTMLEKIKEKWIRDFSMGGDGITSGSKVRTPAFVHGELDVHKIQDSLKDIVVKPLFYEIQNRICMAYGVPPSFFEFGQDYGAQSATIQQQEKNFYNRTIAKNLVSYKAKMERYVLSSFNDEKLILEWDLSAMGAAAFLETDRKTFVLKAWEMGLDTRDSTREQLGLNPIGGEYGDDLYRIDVLGTNNNGDRLNQPSQSAEDNILKPRNDLTPRIRRTNDAN